MMKKNYVFSFIINLAILSSLSDSAHSQLRIVTYNTAGVTNTSAMTSVITALNSESVNGIIKPIDVLLLQELGTGDRNTMLAILNGQGFGTYAAGQMGTTRGFGGVGLIYRTQTVELISDDQVVNTSAEGAARGVVRSVLRPAGYSGEEANFYIYNSHYKANDTPTDAARRDVEATAIRANADALGQGAHIIYAGDFSIYRSSEPMWASLTADGNGQAFDPVNQVGDWHNGTEFIAVHTQNPAGDGFVGAGMDDRFDWQMVTDELLDNEGMSIISGSYHAFGNNGTHLLDGHINTGSGASPAVLDALGATSDHLPVVAQYQVPAVLQAVAGAVPATLNVGETFNLEVTVSNLADVLAAIGADELDYDLTTSGDLSGEFLDQVDLALGGGNTHFVALDTSSPGIKSGTITVFSTSQAVQNGLINIPIIFEVLAADLVAGDYNDDGTVDAADYIIWRKFEGADTILPNDPHGGTIGTNQFNTWLANFGTTATGSGTGLRGVAVPEPNSAALLVVAIGGVATAGLRKKCNAYHTSRRF